MTAEPERPSPSKRRLAYLVGTLVVAASAWAGTEFTNGANPWSPGPLLMILPAWLVGQAILGDINAGPQLIPLIGAVVFLVLAAPVASTRSTAVWPVLVFNGVLVLASIAFFGVSWSYGLEYQGLAYTVTLLVINALLATASVWLALRARLTREYWARYAATLLPVVWFVWFAFPWLGEMP